MLKIADWAINTLGDSFIKQCMWSVFKTNIVSQILSYSYASKTPLALHISFKCLYGAGYLLIGRLLVFPSILGQDAEPQVAFPNCVWLCDRKCLYEWMSEPCCVPDKSHVKSGILAVLSFTAAWHFQQYCTQAVFVFKGWKIWWKKTERQCVAHKIYVKKHIIDIFSVLIFLIVYHKRSPRVGKFTEDILLNFLKFSNFFCHCEQVHELFSKSGDVKRIIIGLDKIKKTACGFCFVEYPSKIFNSC